MAADEAAQAAWKRRARIPLMLLGPLLVVAVALWWYLQSGRYESTDDAYVQAARVPISANVGGQVESIAVHENQAVHRGDLLFRLDPAPLRIAVEDARARLAAARLQVAQLRAELRARRSDVDEARTDLAYLRHESARSQRLLAQGLASQQQADRDAHAVEDARARQSLADRQVDAALASLAGDPHLPVERHPLVQQAQAVLDRARLDLSYATVTAPNDGVVTHVEDLQVGAHVAAAAPLFALVLQGGVWIEANFKEDQLAQLRPGQSATVTVDSLGGRSLHARVASLSPGTGSQFSQLPPENATGNWVKVVQRVPVRLALDDPAGLQLAAGLSATVEVDTGHRRHLGDLFAHAAGGDLRAPQATATAQ